MTYMVRSSNMERTRLKAICIRGIHGGFFDDASARGASVCDPAGGSTSSPDGSRSRSHEQRSDARADGRTSAVVSFSFSTEAQVRRTFPPIHAWWCVSVDDRVGGGSSDGSGGTCANTKPALMPIIDDVPSV